MRTALTLLIVSIFHLPLSFSQPLSSQQIRFLSKKAENIKVDENYANGNWKVILEKVKNKEIVLLGELNHGSKENFLVRNDLVKYLCEHGGFEVILFEAGIGELYALDKSKDEYSAEQLTSGFYGVWHTKEFTDLMQYIKKEKLSIAGFDVQRSNRNLFQLVLKEAAKENSLSAAQSIDLEDRFTTLNHVLVDRKTVYNEVESETRELIADYQRLSNILYANEIAAASEELKFILRTIANRISYLEYYLSFVKDQDWRKRFTARDSVMAANVIWLKEHVYKDKKMIIIGHNFHVSIQNEKEETAGEYLKKQYPDEVYAIGTFIGTGKYLSNSGSVQEMETVDDTNLNIRHLIQAVSGRVNFLQMPQKVKRKTAWLFDHITVHHSFINLNGGTQLILAESFDGILLLDRTSVPEQLKN